MSREAEQVVEDLITRVSKATGQEMMGLAGRVVLNHGIGALSAYSVTNDRGEVIQTNMAAQMQRLIDNTAAINESLMQLIDRMDGGFVEEIPEPKRKPRKPRKPKG